MQQFSEVQSPYISKLRNLAWVDIANCWGIWKQTVTLLNLSPISCPKPQHHRQWLSSMLTHTSLQLFVRQWLQKWTKFASRTNVCTSTIDKMCTNHKVCHPHIFEGTKIMIMKGVNHSDICLAEALQLNTTCQKSTMVGQI